MMEKVLRDLKKRHTCSEEKETRTFQSHRGEKAAAVFCTADIYSLHNRLSQGSCKMPGKYENDVKNGSAKSDNFVKTDWRVRQTLMVKYGGWV